ncbi:hypothetical protein ASD11_05395 [Aeromicrobium sp. Root495]|uniref:hypothetical protein n=1 Tax=Aeromicrobium sp. Root495 TaxID=1736550 RepID=UPI0006F65916|nr:hypothetical protein [Aeromicrobium sp. Root495]KQY59042.1 hypothetical protein ASD11_05395 [Aeromicrobium sp. Root495]
MGTIDRRTLLAGTAALALTACGGGKGGSPEATATKGPNIVKPEAGNVVTPADTAALRKKLNAAFKTRDVEQLVGVIDAEDYSLDDVRKRWTRRYENFDRMGVVDGEWYVGVPSGRTRNGAGGKVEYSGNLVFSHRIKDCDGQDVVESYRADFRKKTEDAPLELLRIGDADSYFDPSFWDVADVDVIEGKHSIVGFRLQDAAKAKRYAATIDAGAKRAFDTMPDPGGVTKVFYALTWKAVDGKLWGGVGTSEADAHAYRHPFLDPQELAAGQKKPSTAKGVPLGTGRVGLHEGSFTRSDFPRVTTHEAVHVLADQWGDGSPPIWVIEGLATWGEYGKDALLAEHGGLIRSGWSRFEKVAPKEYEAFHDPSVETIAYKSGGAVFAYLEDTGGRDAVYEVASTFYGNQSRQEAARKLGRSEKDLLAATKKWLRA